MARNYRCTICTQAHNGINGRYCDMLHRYVEHEHQSPCENSNINPQQ